MDKTKLFSIGEIFALSKVPCSALRYYDEVGVIKPVYIDESSGYRYYDSDTLQKVLVLRYYQILGFKLKEIPELLARDDIFELECRFQEKVAEKNSAIEDLTTERDSLLSWIDLIEETKTVIFQEKYPVELKEFPKQKMYKVSPKPFPKMDFRNILINNEICTVLYPQNTSTLGALYIEYPSEKVRFGDDYNGVTLFIKNHEKDKNNDYIKTVGGFTAVTCYHRGIHEEIGETYEKMKAWAKEHHFILKGNSIERYVIDYWSTTNSQWFLTEIFLPILP